VTDERAFEGTAFLGLARSSKKDPYRLGLFAQHLERGERPTVFLPIQGGTLLVTDRRILQFRPHLDIAGPWNVRRFLGYDLERAADRSDVRHVEYRAAPPSPDGGSRVLEERLLLSTSEGSQEVLLSRGPQAVLTSEEVRLLRTAILDDQAK